MWFLEEISKFSEWEEVIAPLRDQTLKMRERSAKLSFLGDAFIGYVLASSLFERGEGFSVGFLAKAKSALERRKSLAEKVRKLGLKNLGRRSEASLETLFERIVGFALLKLGEEKTRKFLLEIFESDLEKSLNFTQRGESKSVLQEICVGEFGVLPVYKTTGERNKFRSIVYLKDKPLGTGRGRSKKEAEIEAACDALKNLNKRVK